MYRLHEHFSSIYMIQYYLYDYSYGFIKRGLIGTIMNYVPIKINERFVITFNKLLLISLLFILCKILDKINFKDKIIDYLIISCFFLCPALAKNLWFDLKFDILGIIYCGLLIITSIKFGKILLLFSPVLLFIHEGFLFMCIPSLISIAMLRQIITLKKDWIFITLLLITYLAIIILIKNYGSIYISDYDDYLFYIKGKIDSSIRNDDIIFEKNLITGNQIQDIRKSISYNFSHTIFWPLGIGILFSIYIFLNNISQLYEINLSKYFYNILFPIIFNFLMFFLGWDTLRWFSNMSLYMFLIFMTIFLVNEHKTSAKIDLLNNKIYFLFFLLIAYLPFNYLGVMNP
ncbi:hypothetical protein O2K51_03275 [Apibacter raozihei]|uniref:hypothetical protein n=1 Tax=Apibacter raozihei TaxID=2500547 RepID=UPI000FE429AA|nr:hypothetical protein [Apibacter raozihei]